MIITTTRDRYITGEPALSVRADDDDLVDWHLGEAFSGKKPLCIAGVTAPSTEHLWGLEGVHDRSEVLRLAGLINASHGPVYVASPSRAIADMLYGLIGRGRDPTYFRLDQITLSEAKLQILAGFVQRMQDLTPSQVLATWIEQNSAMRQRLPRQLDVPSNEPTLCEGPAWGADPRVSRAEMTFCALAALAGGRCPRGRGGAASPAP